jgi:DNA-directed RNA polymerase subunit RPC12/RpoP
LSALRSADILVRIAERGLSCPHCGARYFGKQKAQEAMDFVAAYPIILEPIDFSLVELAAEYTAKYSFAYADAICAPRQ